MQPFGSAQPGFGQTHKGQTGVQRRKGEKGALCGTLFRTRAPWALTLSVPILQGCCEHLCRAWPRGPVRLAFHPLAAQQAVHLVQGWVCPERGAILIILTKVLCALAMAAPSIFLDSFFPQFPPMPFVCRDSPHSLRCLSLCAPVSLGAGHVSELKGPGPARS